MIDLVFKKKLRKLGHSYYVIVPKPIAKLLDKETKYKFIIMESNQYETKQ